jgi:hypothetical protein
MNIYLQSLIFDKNCDFQLLKASTFSPFDWCFFKEKFMLHKWQSSIGRFRKWKTSLGPSMVN